ncbi:hypothetical protein EX895_004096 [Sporisorium graminicola]|uniref:AB hydrolase-1 domain-containing protein n=1 Tax=Sporisorium graminicola TaxID=280036 RepID=A0A4U7KVK7_9BASI|nr:hypothetical protein EX895_004096 [Sporisorium graminicola]TKY87418.1 hypothetical protein EX895_004096 [Sporisorium graminicola]
MSTKPRNATSATFDLVRTSLYLPLGLAAVYLTFFLALLTPIFQRHFIFLHAIRFPFFPAYDQPAKYGLAPFKTRALTLHTADGERLGAWHVLPEVFYQARVNDEEGDGVWGAEVYEQAMREYPTILYLHGNSMNRAAPWRIAAYSAMTGRVDANVVAIDYRGFGDSSGTPSEQGLVEDAETAWRWIREQQQGTSPGVTVFGQSLGTGIGALLAAKLDRQQTPVDGLVLMAPYTNLKSLVKDFRLGGLLPLLKPIGAIPFNNYILDTFLQTHLSTITTLPHLVTSASLHRTSIVLLHAHDDPVIPIAHSHRLFHTLLSHSASSPSVQSRTVHGYAHIQRFPTSTSAAVTLIETQHGGHNQLTEGALDLVRLALRLPSHLDTS